MKNKIKILLLGTTYILSSCNSLNNIEKNNSCRINKSIIKTIHDEKGIFMIDENSGKPVVSIHSAGSIDDVSLYILCNPPDKLPAKNSSVIISGKVKKSDQVATLGGYTYYELELTSLSVL